MNERQPAPVSATRAHKNLSWLQQNAPEVFTAPEPLGGWPSVIPIEILAGLNRTVPSGYSGPLDLARLSQLRFPAVNAVVTEPLFSGTIYFAQLNFAIQGTGQAVSASAADLRTAISYAMKASPVLAAYTGQYGSVSIRISQALLTHDVSVSSSATYSDADVQTWVNAIKDSNLLEDSACIAILNPAGVTNSYADPSQGVLGYHLKANIPYVFVNLLGQGLTIDDANNYYATALSHEIAELAVDPSADLVNPEVCDPCAGNCNNQYLVFFDASANYIASRQSLPPGFAYNFFTSTVAKPNSATSCPAPQADCAYGPAYPLPQATPLEGYFLGGHSSTQTVIPRAGDFAAARHGQVMFLNRTNAGDGRVLIADFSGGQPPAQVRYWENWNQSTLLNGWEDDNDWALVGDFTGAGHDQVMFLNRTNAGDGRVLIADFSGGQPPAQVRYWENWNQSTLLNGWEDDNDWAL